MPIIDGDPVIARPQTRRALPTEFHFNIEKRYVLDGELLTEYHRWRDDYADTLSMRLWFLRDRFISPEIFNPNQGIVDKDAYFNVVGIHDTWIMAENFEQGLVKNWRVIANERFEG